jgi:beta-mannanase
MGLYLPDSLHLAPWKALRYAKIFGRRFQILSFYFSWGSSRERPDLREIQGVLNSGFIPMITWEPWLWPQELPEGVQPEDQPDFSLEEILSGMYDDYIQNWALDLKQISGPIFFRPLHEMNGNWYPWGGRANGNQPEEYIETWRYIRSIFKENRNYQLIWVWSPYVHSVPDESGNEIWHYYPGSEEVDWLALDGYNWGKTQEWSRWQSFKEIFEEGYSNLIQLSSEKPFMIAEVGCAEEGGNKGKWIGEAFQLLGDKFPKIKALIWFNTKKECDWRIESSRQSLKAFRKSVRNWTFTDPSRKLIQTQ